MGMYVRYNGCYTGYLKKGWVCMLVWDINVYIHVIHWYNIVICNNRLHSIRLLTRGCKLKDCDGVQLN